MVSTRQMAIVSSGTADGSGQVLDNGPARFTRNSVALHGLDVGTGEPQPSTSTALALPQKQTKKLMDLPPELIDKILSYLPFKKICASRLVCKEMDRRCGHILNSTFARLQTQMYNRFQEIKSKMPRRESARRNHHLACESDIIETLHMRLTLLQMTFGKHIERRHCCFFPGDILDEVFNILHYIKVTNKLQRPYKVTDELFDLSTMAMEYFKEKIEPDLPEIAYFSTEFFDFATGTYGGGGSNKYLAIDSSPLGADGKDGGGGTSGGGRGNVGLDSLDEDMGDGVGASVPQESNIQAAVAVVPLPTPPPPPPQANMVLRKRIRKIKQGMRRYNSQLTVLTHDLRACKRKMTEQQRQIADQQKQLAEQQKQTLEYVTRLDENDKKNDEISRKFSTLLQELNKCKTELQYWRSKSPATPPFCTGCGNIIETPPEELRALLNQGVIPEGLEPLAQDELCESRNLATPSTSNLGGDSAIMQHPIPPTPAATPSCSKSGSPQHQMLLFEPAIQCTPLAAPPASSAALAVAMFGSGVEATASGACAGVGCLGTFELDGGSVGIAGNSEGGGMMAHKPGKRKLDMDGPSTAAMGSSSAALTPYHIGGKKARRSKRGKL